MAPRFVSRAAAAALLGLLAAAPAEASFPGRNGVIAFVESGSRAPTAVGAVAPSGRGYRKLVGEGFLFGLSSSPDGGGLAYSDWIGRGGATYLHLASFSGAGGRAVPGPVQGTGPTWSPNGHELAFVRWEMMPYGPVGLGIIGVDGQGLRILTADRRDGGPAFSSRGEVAFVRGDDLYVINADGSGLRRLTNSRAVEESPDFSPDGQRLVFASRGRHAWGGSDLFTMSAHGGPARRLLRSPSDDGAPEWSPDGRQVAFISDKWPVSGLATVGIDGRGYRTIRRLRSPERQTSDTRRVNCCYFSRLTWQPRR